MHGAVDADGGNGRHQRRDRHHDRTDQAGTEPGHEQAGPHHFPANGGHCVPWPHCLLQGKVMSKPQRQRKRKNGTVKKLLVDRFLGVSPSLLLFWPCFCRITNASFRKMRPKFTAEIFVYTFLSGIIG